MGYHFRSKGQKDWKKKKEEEWKKIKASIEKEADEKAVEIGDKAVIDNNVKLDTNVPGPSTKKKGDNVILDGGSGKQDSSGVGGSGTGGSSDTPKISSQDPNNISTIATGSIYNMGSA